MRLAAAAAVLAVLLLGGRALAAGTLRGAVLYGDPNSNAARTSRAWAASRPADARLLARIAAVPQARWFDGQSNRADVAGFVDGAAAAGAVPVLVAYDLPGRDCGGYSAGGAPTPAAYRAWLRHDLIGGIGGHRAAVIVEPDALGELGCRGGAAAATVYALLRDAVRTLAARPGVAVYLDAGNSAWQPAALMARRLRAAGAAAAAGFALNVSSFETTASEAAYGRWISRLLDGQPFVVDTSRNGAGPAPGHAWCNPPGRALGPAPTTQTGDPLIDAYLWIKTPGESDGTCHGGPPAGGWWPDYALGLARRAGARPSPSAGGGSRTAAPRTPGSGPPSRGGRWGG
jgi:endoglucanase